MRFLFAPWRRCLVGLQYGQYHAAISVAGREEFRAHYAFPLLDGKIDASRGTADVRHLVVRRIGTQANWNGREFVQLEGPVMYQAGVKVIEDKLTKLKVHVDPNSLTEAQTLRKLILGRAELAIMLSGIAKAMALEDEFKGTFEILPEPFNSFTIYMAFNRAYFDADPAFAEEVWQNIKRLRARSRVN